MTPIQMRLLLVGITARQPAFEAWAAALDAEGVPYEPLALRGGSLMPLLSRTRSDHLPFQGIIFTAGRALSALTGEEREGLVQMRRRAGIRQLLVVDGEWPRQPPPADGPRERRAGALTAAGRASFPYLQASLDLMLSDRQVREPLDDDERTVLLSDHDGRTLLYLRHREGLEDMVQTIPATVTDLHTPLLRRGQLAWLTRGVRLGGSRHHLGIQVDDTLHSNSHWSVERHASDRTLAAAVRMTPADADGAAAWARSQALRLDLTFNGVGSRLFRERSGLASDPLLVTLAATDDCFGWINHTYDHLNLDTADAASIEQDIARNVSFAEAEGLRIDPHALVTGAHTGLANLDAHPPHGHNPAFIEAIGRQGIRYLAADATRPYPSPDSAEPVATKKVRAATPFRLGPAVVIPRWPAGLAFDATTAEQALDRARTDRVAMPTSSWEDLRRALAERILLHVLSGSPLPFVFHQSNLIAGSSPDGAEQAPLLRQLLDEVLATYRDQIVPDVPLLQPSMAQIGQLLGHSLDWRQAVAAGVVRASLTQRVITVENDTDRIVAVPLTGSAVGEPYAGAAYGWYDAPPGRSEVALSEACEAMHQEPPL